jgi:hypothetical protein
MRNVHQVAQETDAPAEGCVLDNGNFTTELRAQAYFLYVESCTTTFPVLGIASKRVRKQKTHRHDAQLILKLMLKEDFPQIWVPSWENRDLRQLLWHRHRLVRTRTRIMNQLQAKRARSQQAMVCSSTPSN